METLEDKVYRLFTEKQMNVTTMSQLGICPAKKAATILRSRVPEYEAIVLERRKGIRLQYSERKRHPDSFE